MPVSQTKASAERHKRGPKSGPETRDKLLNVAENLFAREGLDAVSLRKIMDEAKVGASQLNYHFGTKKELLRAICQRKLDLLNQERLQLLNAMDDPTDLEKIVEAYLAPALRMHADLANGHSFLKVAAQIGSGSTELAKELATEFLDEFQRQFAAALMRALPALSERDVYWRLHVLLSVVTQTPLNPSRIQKLSRGLCDPSNAEETLQYMMPLLVATLAAPALQAAPRSRRKSTPRP